MIAEPMGLFRHVLDGPAHDHWNRFLTMAGRSRRDDARSWRSGGACRLTDRRAASGDLAGFSSVPASPPDEALDQLRRQYLGSDRRAGQGIGNTSPSGEDEVFQQAGFLPAETVTVPDRRTEPVPRRTADPSVIQAR
jgi:hypothetical protein